MLVFFTLVFFAVIMLWFYCLHAKKQDFKEKQEQRFIRLFIFGGGILLPSVTIAVILFFGIPIGNRILPHPEKQIMRIDVIAHQWYWEIFYPEANIRLINNLHLPLNQPVDMYITSHDVIHSFWIPRLNGKMDAIPGHTNVLRLEATKAGYLRGQCAEFCGVLHAQMALNIQVHEAETFKQWLQKPEASPTPQTQSMSQNQSSTRAILK